MVSYCLAINLCCSNRLCYIISTMKPPKAGSDGYTIIEVMIFLVISMAMFASVVTMMSTQNRRNQFTESVNTFNQKLQDIMNDVDTGYFPSNDIDCNGSASAGGQGTNSDCVYMGKAIQFAPQGKPDGYTIYTLVGDREYLDGAEKKVVTKIEDSDLRGIDQNESGSLSADVEITRVIRAGDTTPQGGLAILAGFAKSSSTSATGVETGSTKSTLAGVGGGTLADRSVFVGQLSPTGVVPTSEILICLQEKGGGRKATIQIGGVGVGQLTTQVTIDSTDSRCP